MNKYIQESLKYILRSNVVISPYIRQINRLYALNAEELYNYNEKRFLKIFRRAITKSVFYKKLYSEHSITINDVTSLKDIIKLPKIEKKMVNVNPKALLTVPGFFIPESHTSGTTGAPLIVYNDYFSCLREQAYHYVFRERRGFKYGQRMVSLRGHLGREQMKLKVHISNTLYLSSYQINEDNIEKYYHEILSFNPVAIEGYPSSLYNMCFLFKNKNLKLNISRCFTSSETLFQYQRKMIEEILNTEIHDLYGNTERTICLAECMNHNGYFSQPGYSINEFKDDCIITTSLINSCFPLIRYKVDDIVSLRLPPLGTVPELSIVDSIEGRIEDVIIAKDGSLIGRLNFLFKNLSNIKLAQILQKKKGEMIINVVPDGIFSENEKEKLLANIDKRIGLDNINVNVSLVDDREIIYTNRNKFRQVISDIKHA